eukprot:TRINITY_DN5165_c0_g1_i1.p1 TRINITY_DN5165_c0_g1~~TRINITY_DN5165_c0_g1_i1.p1  ORF type:complete len:154 (-),score=39.98 TRINITY_DN5165_c0_g1_i1:90-551(-)
MLCQAPRNFSYVLSDQLAGMGMPTTQAHVAFLVKQGIRNVVSLEPPPVPLPSEITHKRIDVEDFSTPTLEQVQEFVSFVSARLDAGEKVAVHCFAGVGRTGTMLACFLVYRQHLPADEAIRRLRALRPGSVETTTQAQLVRDYHGLLYGAGPC